MEENLPLLRKIKSRYSLRDVFNADEFGLYYRRSPNVTIGPARMQGRKRSKDRITFLPCCNSDGTERLPLLVIGRSEKTPCSGGISGSDLGFDYHHSEKAWMNRAIFFLGCFD